MDRADELLAEWLRINPTVGADIFNGCIYCDIEDGHTANCVVMQTRAYLELRGVRVETIESFEK